MKMANVNCANCNKSITVRQADINRGWGKYCSKTCKAQHQEKKTGQYTLYLQNKHIAQVSNKTLTTTGWLWRQSKGRGYISPKDMATTHLFHTLRMIWNNCMPLHMNVGNNPIHYKFDPIYTDSYLKEAIIMIGSELMGRTDLKPMYQKEFKQMRDYILNRIKSESANEQITIESQ